MTAWARGVAGLLLLVYVTAVAGVLLAAEPTVAAEVITRTESRLEAWGAPAGVTAAGRVELVLNALMFAPITFLAAVAWPRQAWGTWVAYAFVASGLVEVVQGFVLEPRSAQYVDVVANTLGGLIGALASVPVVALLRRVSDERSAR